MKRNDLVNAICLTRGLSWLAFTVGVVSGAAGLDPGTLDLTREYRVDHWKTDQGLPQNSVEAILQTRDGYLWIGTRSGLVRFDGLHFTRFDELGAPLVRNWSFLSLAEDQDGALWMGTADGLLKWSGRALTHYTKSDGLYHNRVWSLVVARTGELWIGTEEGVNVLRSGRILSVHPSRTRQVREDARGGIWIWSDGQLQQWNVDSNRFVLRQAAWHDTFCFDPHGVLWWKGPAGLRCLRDGQVTEFSAESGLKDSYVEFVYADRAGGLWVNTHFDGLHVLQAGRFRRTLWKNVCGMGEDREGNLWIGTTAEGLFRLQRQRVYVYSSADGLLSDEVSAVCGAADGTVWIATPRGLSRIHENTVKSFPAEPYGPLDFKAATSLLTDREGGLWVGTRGGANGICRFEGGRFIRDFHPNQDFLAGFLMEDKAGSLWATTSVGVFRREQGKWARFGHPDDPLLKEVSAMREDRAGALWFGTKTHGLLKWADGKFTSLTSKARLVNDQVQCLHEEADGALWIGTKGGLSRLKDGQLTSVTAQQGLFDNLINSILEDDQNHFWIGCLRGIYRVGRKALNDAADGRTNSLRYIVCGEADGMLSSETKAGQWPAAWKGPDGRLWFATLKGAVVIDPKTIRDNQVAPPVVIEQVRADDDVVYGDGLAFARAATSESRPIASVGGVAPSRVRLAPGRARVLEVRYTGNSFIAPEKLRFQYRLEGYDADWREDRANRRIALYTNLRPGDYRFRVRAFNNDGLPSEREAQMAFFLAPHFYETWPFYLASGFGVILAGYGLHANRLRKLRRLDFLERQYALEMERARIAHDIHDDLGSRLSQVSILQELVHRNPGSPAAAPHLLEKLRATTAETFLALDEIVWAVNPRQDSLAGLVSYLREYVPEFLSPAGIHTRLDFPNPVPECSLTADARHDIFLVAKEVLNNVVKHAHAKEVWVRARLDEGRLRLSIEDDGCGFVETPGEESVGAGRRNGNGLASLRRRVARLGGQLDLQSEPGHGTRIHITVPMAPESRRA